MKSNRGGIRIRGNLVYARIRCGDDQQFDERLPWASAADESLARKRSTFIADLISRLVAAGLQPEVRKTARLAARATTSAELIELRNATNAKLDAARVATKVVDKLITFGDVFDMWTTNAIHERYPDRVKFKEDFHLEMGRYRRYLEKRLKDVPISAFLVGYADEIMASLPKERIKTSAARFQIAQIMHRVLSLAANPLGYIERNPFPEGWLPKIRQTRLYSCLFPREEENLLGCKEVDEAFRLFIGVLDREGMRISELLDADWDVWNLDEGIFRTTRTKKGVPNFWACQPDTIRAMRLWKEGGGKRTKRPFQALLPEKSSKLQIASRLREELWKAGVRRVELHKKTEYTGMLRAHDMRATFVTVSLAQGRSPIWIMDRTGHTTLAMVDRYRRAARQFEELKLGPLCDLVDGLGWGITRGILAKAVGSEVDPSTDDDEEFRRRDSNPNKRIQNSPGRIGTRPEAANTDVEDAESRLRRPRSLGDPSTGRRFRRPPKDVQTFVAKRLEEALEHVFIDTPESIVAVLRPLERAAKALDRGRVGTKRKVRSA